jgi:hypothetical protein
LCLRALIAEEQLLGVALKLLQVAFSEFLLLTLA